MCVCQKSLFCTSVFKYLPKRTLTTLIYNPYHVWIENNVIHYLDRKIGNILKATYCIFSPKTIEPNENKIKSKPSNFSKTVALLCKIRAVFQKVRIDASNAKSSTRNGGKQ